MINHFVCLLRLMAVFAVASSCVAQTINRCVEDQAWVRSWGASLYSPPKDGETTLQVAKSQTLRQRIRVSAGGEKIRIKFSNEFGTKPLRIGAASVARSSKDGAIESASLHKITFNGASSVVIPPGAPFLSDPIELQVAPLSELIISIFAPDETTLDTIHGDYVYYQSSVNYISTKGDYTEKEDMPREQKMAYAFLGAVDVFTSVKTGVIVALGDSITDGFKENQSWTARLAERLINARDGSAAPMAVINAGLGGNELLANVVGDGALARFDRDVLAVPGLTHVIVLEGLNDIGIEGIKNVKGELWRTESYGDKEIIAAYKQLIERAHEHKIKIYGGTITPFSGFKYANYYSPKKDRIRQAVNEWIRTSGAFDAVIDFERAVRDPNEPIKLAAPFDSGDHAHPGDDGHKALGNAIDLTLFRLDKPCRE